VASFDDGQRAAWESFSGTTNVAVVGPAGCGKSQVLLPCIADARLRFGNDAVLVMAWTWVAAEQIDGQSYHSYLGITPVESSKERSLEMVRSKPRICTKLQQSRVVFIDEAFTFPGRHFVQLEYVLRCLSPAHMQGEPWGGRQVIRTLSVVPLFASYYFPTAKPPFDLFTTCFSALFSGLILTRVCLVWFSFLSILVWLSMSTVAGDPCQLGPVLQDEMSREPFMYETSTWRQTVCSAWGSVVELTGAHRHADDLQLLDVLRRIRVGEQTDEDIALLNSSSTGVSDAVWEQHTQLRATNVAVDAVNNARMAQLPSAAVEFKATDALFVAHPARVRYALGKLAGMVAASKEFKVRAVVILTRQVESVPAGTQGKVTRVVGGMYVDCVFAGRAVRVRPQSFDLVDNCGEKLASRSQIPLVLGWAVTMHRCQGLTLDSLAIDFTKQKWKKEGLVYSGLSRCRALRGFVVRGLRHELIVVSARAMRFYRSLH